MGNFLVKLQAYLKFSIDFFLLRKDVPYVLGLVITDRCNLKCIHCRIADSHGQNMPMHTILEHLQTFYAKGARFLYLYGGEPYLWRDGHLQITDIAALTKKMGYLRVHIFTNGTVPLNSAFDFTWISIDGLEETHKKIRGVPLDGIGHNVKQLTSRHAIIFTVNSINKSEVVPFCLTFCCQHAAWHPDYVLFPHSLLWV